jgi:hypothetical protein
MNRHVTITISAAVVLIAANMVPFKTGPTVGGYCGMVYQRHTLTVFGVPYGYLQNTTHTGCEFTLVKQGKSTFKTDHTDGLTYDNYHFKAAAFIADAAIIVIFLAAIYTVGKKLPK